MVSQERILEIAKECEEIMKHSKLNEGNKSEQFSSLEEVLRYYDAEPFDDFDKRYMSGN